MANVPDELQYSEEHEWVSGELTEDSVVTVGITEHAADALGDIVYVELPTVGDTVSAGEVCGELESTKAVSELYSPVSGEVVAVNEELSDSPELIGQDAYGEGWIYKARISEVPKGLLDSEAYSAITE
ncbi:glycine cleavage system protein GcvH [Demequina capsici]|uniref:Glycine cleavage system H protein n=1 Tax=Demequina capsici TaxID=3075620 RepID=A0AA96J9N4_9MICO|nr:MULTISPECIES: glycine cleavage system protein GcvH [unclassified Demequina]WNM24613.1 glycine cleavage system protein GcvH [Demequina sp. OYTSA14]WNM27462.1 glycine cleavage system protein GcvH [Demequina sp. PMTSA13]